MSHRWGCRSVRESPRDSNPSSPVWRSGPDGRGAPTLGNRSANSSTLNARRFFVPQGTTGNQPATKWLVIRPPICCVLKGRRKSAVPSGTEPFHRNNPPPAWLANFHRAFGTTARSLHESQRDSNPPAPGWRSAPDRRSVPDGPPAPTLGNALDARR